MPTVMLSLCASTKARIGLTNAMAALGRRWGHADKAYDDVHFDHRELARVIFGARCTQEDRDALRAIVTQTSICTGRTFVYPAQLGFPHSMD